ncbi:MAG: hypothetical protein ACJ74G_08905 [Blastocatellia bacterium]
MANLVDHARPATERLLTLDDDQLYAELAMRMQEIRRDPALSADFNLAVESPVESMGALADLADFGRRFFNRVSRQAYALMCGDDAEDSNERHQLTQAFGLGKDAVAPALAALIVAHLGFAPAIAAVIAALAVKLFFKPAYEAMCEVWKEKLA